MVCQFQAGDIHYIITPAAVGGTGITLTRGKYVIMVEALSDSGLWDQCIARVHRCGNTHEVVLVYEVPNTSSAVEMQAKRKREGRHRLADAQAATMVRQTHEHGEVMNDQEIIDLTNNVLDVQGANA